MEMKESARQAVSVMVTCQELNELADCGRRMTEYADSEGTRLITVLYTHDGIPVRLILDRQCIGCIGNCCRTEVCRAKVVKISQARVGNLVKLIGKK